MNTPDDARLRREFERLREEDRRGAPDFADTLAAAVARGRRRTQHLILAAVTAAAIVITIAIATSRAPRPRATGSLLTWSSPTAFLLETPGKALWKELPRFPEAQRRKDRP